ncbi:DNA repair endonuclease XPF mei-9 [Oratosquilla oratoria]|uniref:DNA repair endonuclease XPF mei-9 n=1 Tax=Oratosquilla oratoria TaxID=337810 RepID=UPI003F76D35B
MLEYENQMFLDLLHEDGLLIAAKGLGLESLLVSLITTYNDPGNLVLVVGTSPKEEEYLLQHLQENEVSPIPKKLTSDYSVGERSNIYMDGGVLFVTSRILVMDLLIERIPVDLVTGIIVWRAHRVIESCQDAFILRLFRQKNKTGFIKALSSSPMSFTVGFCKVERVMRNLFVKKLYLWPRFHADINTCLSARKPEVIELHLTMTNSMKQIQMAVLDLITNTVQELRRSNNTIDIDEFCPENAISRAFEKMVKLQLEPIWHQLSIRTKQLIADLKVLRTILEYLCQYDCVTFYNLVSSLQTTEKAMQSGGWMLLASAETLFVNAKLRIFGENKASPTKKQGPQSSNKEPFTECKLEENPKWLALSEILAEVRQEAVESKDTEKCLIVTQDDRTAQQLKEFLMFGAQPVLQRLFYSTVAVKFGIPTPSTLPGKTTNQKGTVLKERKDKKGKAKGKTNEEEENATLTQIAKKYDFIGKNETEEDTEEVEFMEHLFLSPLILVQPLKNASDPLSLNKILKEMQPKYIIMYDLDLSFVRLVESWQARQAEEQVKVYFLVYKGTVEEQVYLTNIKREKDAFEYLIKEKANMIVPEYLDGKQDDHPDLIRDAKKPSETVPQNQITRKGGQVEEPQKEQRVIVDMREFRSELPALLHKRGIDIDPVTIEVGDYILTPDICVERKSLSDLIGSLNSGRLYNQAQSMTRFYKKPILLIEFDQNKPFHLQGRFFLSSDGSSSSKDVAAKLQLLTLHFPKLRLLWCPSPYATAEVFQLLKTDKEQPTVEQAQAITAESNPDADIEKFNPQIKDFITKLPGINTKNMYTVLNRVTNLVELMTLTQEDLTDILGNSKNALALHSALHHTMKQPINQDAVRGRGKFTKKGVKRFRK